MPTDPCNFSLSKTTTPAMKFKSVLESPKLKTGSIGFEDLLKTASSISACGVITSGKLEV
jgi:hypothetical protein